MDVESWRKRIDEILLFIVSLSGAISLLILLGYSLFSLFVDLFLG